jgi:hypothetical protein
MATGAGLAKAAALAQGGKVMLVTRVKVAAVLLVAVGLAAGGVGLYGQRTPEKDFQPGAVREPERPRKPDAAPQAVRIAATLNGEPILGEEVYAAAYLALPNPTELAAPERARRITAGWRKTLDRVIEREVVLQHAFTSLRGRDARVLGKLQEVAAKEFGQRWVETAKRTAGLRTGAGS